MTHVSNSISQSEREMLESGLKKTEVFLREFEERYNLSSEVFFKQYLAGEMDDRNDFIDWAGEYQIYLSIGSQLGEQK